MEIGLLNQSGSVQQDIYVKTIDSLFVDKKAALVGGGHVIKKNNPKLMISGYHKIEDLWEIPETIWKINENYKIYVGHAPGVSMELEFYCAV